MRQPQASSCGLAQHRLQHAAARTARPAGPPISVTYWKLEKKPRRFLPAISRQIGRARAIFAADRQPLQQPRDHQQRRREHADLS